MKKFIKEFKAFISRGNVIDMAVGVIIGGAFSAIVTALTNNIIRPLINWVLTLILGNSEIVAYTYLTKVFADEAHTVIDLERSIYIDWGAFISAIINFLLIALVLFLIIKAINAASAKAKEAKEISEVLTKEEIEELKAKKATYAEIRKAVEDKKASKAAEEANKPKPLTTEEILIQIRDKMN